MADAFRPTICIDFDGVIHSYGQGWQEGRIYGDLVPGFADWVRFTAPHFQLTIYSSRSATAFGIERMQDWLQAQLQRRMPKSEAEELLSELSFASEKPAAWLTIDDRCIRFEGDWMAKELRVDALLEFKPWNARLKV